MSNNRTRLPIVHLGIMEKADLIFEKVELYNVVEVVPAEDEGLRLARIPTKLIKSIPLDKRKNPAQNEVFFSTAGCEVRFNIEGESAKIVLKDMDSLQRYPFCPAILEIYQGSFQVSWHVIKASPTEISVSLPQNIERLERIAIKNDLPFDAHLTRVILPYYHDVRLLSIDGDVAPPKQDQTPKNILLAYGSSISQGFSAIRPTGSYPMMISQMLGVDLIHMGFGGGAWCERPMADYIAQRDDWNLAIFEIGINMIRRMDNNEFIDRVQYFLEKIAKTNLDKWIFCTDMFTFVDDLDPDTTSIDYLKLREIVRTVVEKLNLPRLTHIDGRKIMNTSSGLDSSLLHASTEGIKEIAQNFCRFINNHEFIPD